MADASRLRPYRGVRPTLGARVYVDPQAAVIGAVTLGADVSVWPMAVLRGDVHSIRLGARSNVQDGCVLHVTHDGPYSPGGLPLVLGDDVTVGHHAVLHACTLGSRILVGMGAIVLDGVVVEDEVVIGAGAVVPPRKRLAARTLWVKDEYLAAATPGSGRSRSADRAPAASAAGSRARSGMPRRPARPACPSPCAPRARRARARSA
jgi:carbonic anhydrase/acetyltransferase-like protein (isoleucine patch superfamily)